LSKLKPRSERNSPEYNSEVLICKPSCSTAMSHQFLLTKLWLMLKRCPSYPFQNLCTCSFYSRRDAIPSSCTQMYPPAKAFTLELNNILYPVFCFQFPFSFHSLFLPPLLSSLSLLSFLLCVLLKDAVSC
jgi:hypothetical protein